MHIEIYSKTQCPYCDMAVKKAESMAKLDWTGSGTVTFEKYMLDKEFNREELFELFPGARTFPQIKIDGESIGGWDQFKEL